MSAFVSIRGALQQVVDVAPSFENDEQAFSVISEPPSVVAQRSLFFGLDMHSVFGRGYSLAFGHPELRGNQHFIALDL